MTLLDAYAIHVRKLHARTMRPFIGFRVVTPANQNTRAPSSLSLSHGQPREAGFVPSGLASHFAGSINLLHAEGITS